MILKGHKVQTGPLAELRQSHSVLGSLAGRREKAAELQLVPVINH
jgi:hypothetical protein